MKLSPSQIKNRICQELFPNEVINSQKYWNRHIEILKNYNGVTDHLSTLLAIIDELIIFFERSRDSRDALLLLTITTTLWAVFRRLAEIKGKNDVEWLRKKYENWDDKDFSYLNSEVCFFLNNMRILHEWHSFLRHPYTAIANYSWILGAWQQKEVDMLLVCADIGSSLTSVLIQTFSITAGWAGEIPYKQIIHDEALTHL